MVTAEGGIYDVDWIFDPKHIKYKQLLIECIDELHTKYGFEVDRNELGTKFRVI